MARTRCYRAYSLASLTASIGLGMVVGFSVPAKDSTPNKALPNKAVTSKKAGAPISIKVEDCIQVNRL
jgi:hypothetical protein